MPDDRAIRVSIIVACRNEKHDIHRLLDSILSQDLVEPWEAIIADGMSDDGTREVLEEYSARYSQLRIVDNPGRIVSTGLNAAIRSARGDVIIRMDGHTRYARDYCRACLDVMKRTGADNVGGPARTQAGSVLGRAVAAAYHSRFSTGGAKFHDVTHRGWVDTVPYGCWRKSILEHIGLFDETLVRNQDDELNLRLIRKGGRIWLDPAIQSWYSPRPRLTPLFRQYFQYGFWKVAVIRKHHLPASWRHLVPVLFVLTNLILALSLALGLALAQPDHVRASAWTWFGLLGLYAAANLAASSLTAAREGWQLLPYLPAVFAAYHFSYGFGFLLGLRSIVSKSDALPRESVFTALTR